MDEVLNDLDYFQLKVVPGEYLGSFYAEIHDAKEVSRYLFGKNYLFASFARQDLWNTVQFVVWKR